MDILNLLISVINLSSYKRKSIFLEPRLHLKMLILLSLRIKMVLLWRKLAIRYFQPWEEDPQFLIFQELKSMPNLVTIFSGLRNHLGRLLLQDLVILLWNVEGSFLVLERMLQFYIEMLFLELSTNKQQRIQSNI